MISAVGAFRIAYVKKHTDLQLAGLDCEKLNVLIIDGKRMVLGMTAALALSFVMPGWNLLAIMVPKLLPKPR
jgi:hypothetical protein